MPIRPVRAKTLQLLLCTGFCTLSLMACSPEVSDLELARRIDRARFDWQNYQEDIKGQIGATPAAEWQGTPTRAWRDSEGIRIECQISGPWAERSMALPILVRDPSGLVRQSMGAECTSGKAVYLFPPSILASTNFDFIEVKFPHGERRLVLEKAADSEK